MTEHMRERSSMNFGLGDSIGIAPNKFEVLYPSAPPARCLLYRFPSSLQQQIASRLTTGPGLGVPSFAKLSYRWQFDAVYGYFYPADTDTSRSPGKTDLGKLN
jgi:hypothetical protein